MVSNFLKFQTINLAIMLKVFKNKNDVYSILLTRNYFSKNKKLSSCLFNLKTLNLNKILIIFKIETLKKQKKK